MQCGRCSFRLIYALTQPRLLFYDNHKLPDLSGVGHMIATVWAIFKQCLFHTSANIKLHASVSCVWGTYRIVRAASLFQVCGRRHEVCCMTGRRWDRTRCIKIKTDYTKPTVVWPPPLRFIVPQAAEERAHDTSLTRLLQRNNNSTSPSQSRRKFDVWLRVLLNSQPTWALSAKPRAAQICESADK